MTITFKSYIPNSVKKNNNNKRKKTTTTTKNKQSKAEQTNKQILNNKDPNKTRNYILILKYQFYISQCILLSLS